MRTIQGFNKKPGPKKWWVRFCAKVKFFSAHAIALIVFTMVAIRPAAAVPFHLLTESDPGGLGNIVLSSFNSLTDLANLNVASSSFIGQNNWGTGVSAGGLTYDGAQYHLLTESDPGGLGNIVLSSFNSLTDLVNLNVASSSFIGQNNWGSGVSAMGLDFDGTQFHLLTESDPGGLGNIVLSSFNSLTDLVNLNVANSSFIGQNKWGSGVSARGLASSFTQSSQVPEPTTLSLIGLALAGLGWSRRKKSI